MARFEFKLPDIGEGVAEGEVVAWHVKSGDVVKEDQAMVEVMTDKATVTIGAPKKGTILMQLLLHSLLRNKSRNAGQGKFEAGQNSAG